MSLQVLRCGNMGCRVETFKGDLVVPLSGCPVCLTAGWPVPTQIEGPVDTSTVIGPDGAAREASR